MIDDYIDRYIKLRDAKAALKKKFDDSTQRLDDAMTLIEQALAKALTDSGMDRMGCAAGTVFFQNSTSATVVDGTAFFEFLRGTDQWHLADIRAAKRAVAEWKDEHGDLPPGINWREARVVRVNRP